MTVIIEAWAQNGIVIGSDSQETFQSVIGPKRLGMSKIIDITWPPQPTNAEILLSLAFAGSVPIISRLIDEIYMIIQDDENRPETLQEFINILEARFMQYYKVLDYDVPRYLGVSETPAPFDVELALAGVYKGELAFGYVRGKPPLFTRLRPEDVYEVLGSGLFYGDVLMRRLYTPELNVIEAGYVIGYVISEIAKFDPNVGLPANIRYYEFGEDNTITRNALTDDFEEFGNKLNRIIKEDLVRKVKELLQDFKRRNTHEN